MVNKWHKVSITEKQGEIVFNAVGCNDYVICFSDGYSFFAKETRIFGAFFNHIPAKHFMLFQKRKGCPGFVIVISGSYTL